MAANGCVTFAWGGMGGGGSEYDGLTRTQWFDCYVCLWTNRHGVRPFYGEGAGKGRGTGKGYSSEISEDDEPKGKGKGNLGDGAAGIVAAAPCETQVAASSRQGVADAPLEHKSGADDNMKDHREHYENGANWDLDCEEHPGDDHSHDEDSSDEGALDEDGDRDEKPIEVDE